MGSSSSSMLGWLSLLSRIASSYALWRFPIWHLRVICTCMRTWSQSSAPYCFASTFSLWYTVHTLSHRSQMSRSVQTHKSFQASIGKCVFFSSCRESSDIRHLAIVYIATRAIVFALMTKTQIDEKRYIMPQLRRYDLLTLEILDRELHAQEAIDHLLESLPHYTIDKIKEILTTEKQQLQE